MDTFDVLLQAGLITFGIVVYLLFKRSVNHGNYKQAGWNYAFKYLFGRYAVRRWKAGLARSTVGEEARADQREGWDAFSLRCTAPDGTTLVLGIKKLCARQPLAETTVYVKLADGTAYVLPQSPDSTVCAWEAIPNGWAANGLKIHITEPTLRCRVIYNGLLTRVGDGRTQHVKLNLVWSSISKERRYPEDWSSQLAARALALEPWRDSKWSTMLGIWKDGSWVQFGALQGRFQSFTEAGLTDRSEYLEARGLRERAWAPAGCQALRRSVHVTAAAVDGTVVHLKCVSYRNVLTEVISGFVRLPNFAVEAATGTDLQMSAFSETPRDVASVYTVNISTSTRDIKVLLRLNASPLRHYSGAPYQLHVHYYTTTVSIDGYPGTGVCELAYEATESKQPPYIGRAALLRWVPPQQAGPAGYCVSLDERAAACTDYVGGKGASLALLASMQREEGYRVPPGFCLTVKALDKYLESNPDIKDAIKQIEAANVNYEEANFKDKCEKACTLFASTEITGELKEEILSSVANLRSKAMDEKLGPELRFAVRSSAVGEDSEVLSAAGQNETILGSQSDEDVLSAVRRCWASMFSFTSAYYRRQNGQPCLCGGGVVVQVLVSADVAGVLFTRDPAHGDPTRLLLTANYGLGESVVSGSVEPDTFTITRSHNPAEPALTITARLLGHKTRRVTVQGNSVSFEDVPLEHRSESCLTDEQVLRLARLGVVQDQLWAAPRDLEWALVGDEVFLLQARPITALERWTEEELLHELDWPVMSEHELITFGNTGEVMPRPLTALTYDLVIIPLKIAFHKIRPSTGDSFDDSVVVTHNRGALALYNSMYRHVAHEIDVKCRMVEMAVHGHPVADDSVLAIAMHRNRPKWHHFLNGILLMIKSLLISKRRMKSSIKVSHAMSPAPSDELDPKGLYRAAMSQLPAMNDLSYSHSITSVASTSSQLIAMSVLLEGRQDFSSEICNEIAALLSSGDVLSAEVPSLLAKLARMLEASGHYDDFRALDPKDAMKWLKKNLPHVYLDVCSFLEQHGHRAVMEFDLSTKPWILRPEDMMRVLQTLTASADAATTKTDDDIIASLKTPQKTSTRKVLRWVMPLCRRTVRHREGTKAHLILGVHKLRLILLQLGQALVRSWHLPSEDLVFHFRAHELRDYIDTRDPALLRKAAQRQQYHPNWCKLRFAELNTGWVRPLQPRAGTRGEGDLRIGGASVCGGDVEARACVVKDLSEISRLQAGDILITHATDIGWSPYFPMLSGIVTELGGLISHGAVIAREYGLPCIVGATDATDMFRTGDRVRLSGTHGTLERITPETTE